jgi:enoyl-CoA hydratase
MFREKAANVIVEKKDKVAYLTLNRPDVLNALSIELLADLRLELESIQQDDKVQGVFITGAGDKAFSAGADISVLQSSSPLEVREMAELAISVNQLLENLGKVSIALINGFALGGGLELAESCMLRVAVEGARMGHPEVRIGAVPGWGGTTRLARLVGKGRAAELLLTGKMISAKSACQIGLVNHVVEQGNLDKEGDRLMSDILANGPVAVKLTWQAMHRGLNMTLEESARLGADYFGLAATTEDFRIGTSSFLNKSKPEFKGK